jgi:hypothetical protein
MPVTINGDGSITGLSVGGLGSGVVNQATLANNAVNASKIDLTDNYAFTGTFTTPNGYNLLATRNDSSVVSYNTDVEVMDLNPYLSTYDVFFFDLKYYNADSGGSQHLYFKFLDTGGNECDIRFVSNGYSQNGSVATPHNGTGGYFRPAFANQYATTATYQFYLYNSTLSDTSLDATITGQSSWYRESAGVSAANFAAQASGDDKFAKFILNADQYSSPAGQNGRVNLKVYGVS